MRVTTTTLATVAVLVALLLGCGSSTTSDKAQHNNDALCHTTPGSPPASSEVELLGAAQGLGGPVVDAAPDAAGNLWAVSPDALYIRRAGQTALRKYTNSDGLHIYKTITAVAGAGANEGYVGLLGYESDDPFNDPQALREEGKLEHVHLLADGSIQSLHYAQLHNDNSANYWETRSTRRLLFARCGGNSGHLFVGGNHGVTHIVDDHWGDHIHVDVTEPGGSQLLGEFYGLALDPATDGLWTCGRYACGLQKFYEQPEAWVAGSYQFAFTVFLPGHDLSVPAGYHEDHAAVAVTPDGVAWFLSSTMGLARWDRKSGNYASIERVPVPGLGASAVDMVADSDGTLFITDGDQLLRYTPATGKAVAIALPVSDIRRLHLDGQSAPRALYVAAGNGLAIYRGP